MEQSLHLFFFIFLGLFQIHPLSDSDALPSVCNQDIELIFNTIKPNLYQYHACTNHSCMATAISHLWSLYHFFNDSSPLQWFMGFENNDLYMISNCQRNGSACDEFQKLNLINQSIDYDYTAVIVNNITLNPYLNFYPLIDGEFVNTPLFLMEQSGTGFPTTQRAWYTNFGWVPLYLDAVSSVVTLTYSIALADDNCEQYGAIALDTIDCRPIIDVTWLGWATCSPDSPCDDGFGDCTSDDDCAENLVCYSRSMGETRIGYNFEHLRDMDTHNLIFNDGNFCVESDTDSSTDILCPDLSLEEDSVEYDFASLLVYIACGLGFLFIIFSLYIFWVKYRLNSETGTPMPPEHPKIPYFSDEDTTQGASSFAIYSSAHLDANIDPRLNHMSYEKGYELIHFEKEKRLTWSVSAFSPGSMMSQIAEKEGMRSMSAIENEWHDPKRSMEASRTSALKRHRITFSEIMVSDKIGSGKFGEVYRGVYRGFPVACKKWKFDGHESEEKQKKELIEEAKTLAKLRNHGNICRFFGVSIDQNIVYLVFDLYIHGDLKRCMKKKSFNQAQKVNFARQISAGLWAIHDSGYLHGDLACRNVLVNLNDMRLALTDFGLSKFIAKAERYSAIRLPIAWSSPETVKHRKRTTKSDIWSFGVTMFEIMTDGNNPYSECNSPAEIILKVADGISPNVDTSWPLAEIMQNCFACHPDNRPTARQCHEFLYERDDLIEFCQEGALETTF